MDEPRPDRPETQHRAPVLHLHGWTDYFYNLPMARSWAHAGHQFYALDLRKYGRSLRASQSPGYVEDLTHYYAEINEAVRIIGQENPQAPAPIIHAHSTGGLVAALWAQEHPDAAGALVLNAPWLEVPGDLPARAAVDGLVSP
ncbi:alpha/beta fold hydrolase [Nesterenkonia pannonica]|nr:alpha/beta fold hydrolase [Nesterenkonia pannonica]